MSNKVIFDPVKKVWRGPSVGEYPYGAKSVGEVIYEVLRQDLDHVCQVGGSNFICNVLYD